MHKRGVLLVGHGTRSPTGTEQFLHLSHAVARQLAPLPVEHAFLELQQPDIAAAITRLAERDITEIVIAPLLLFAAGHAKQDIPQAALFALNQLGIAEQVALVQAGHFGCHPALVELSRRRYTQAVRQHSLAASQQVSLILVGRGSQDATATAEMLEYVGRRKELDPALQIDIAFLAMAQPLLLNRLQTAKLAGTSPLVVQPHLLFEGDLTTEIDRQVTQDRANPRVQWIVTPALADPLGERGYGTDVLTKVILDRLEEAWIRVAAPGACS